MTFKALAVERLTVEEQQQMDAIALVNALHEVKAEQAFLGRRYTEERFNLRDARNVLFSVDQSDRTAVIEARCTLENVKAIVDVILHRNRILREIRTSLQSLLKVEQTQ